MSYILLAVLAIIAGWLARGFAMYRSKNVVNQAKQPALNRQANSPLSRLSDHSRKQADTEKIQLVIAELIEVDPKQSFQVYLSFGDGERLSMMVGYFEAQSIAIEMNHLKTARPMTFDLLQTLLLAGNFAVKEIVIDAIIDQLFYSTIVLQQGDGELELDARPSDALVIALKNEAPIYCYKSVVNAYRATC